MKTLEDIESGKGHAFAIWELIVHRGKFMILTRRENEGPSVVTQKTISREQASRILAHSNCPVCGGFLTTYNHEKNDL